jgi:predicted Zn-dependent peptidase
MIQTIIGAILQRNVMRLFVAFALLASFAAAQKEPPLPKDLPPYGPEKPLAAPSVKSAKLDNGLNIWLVSEPGFPKVALTVAVRGGLAADPANLPGLSELLSRTIDQGTRTRSAKQIAQEMQAAGGDLNASAGKDSIELSSVALSSKVDGAVTLLADILRNASFPEAEVALAKRNLTDSLEQREAEPSFLAARARDRVLFSDHPYHVTSPTRDSIAVATPADLREIFAQRFRPDQVIFVAVGDFQNDKMLANLNSALGSWKAPANPAAVAIATPSVPIEHAVYIVPRPGSVQTTVELAAIGPKLGDPEYEATQVANTIYGGAFSSRLTTNIREDKGYTYSPYSRLASYQKAAEIISHADVRNEVTAPALNEMEYELNRLATTSPTDEELTKAKRFIVGLEALRLQDRGSLAGRLATLWIAGLLPDQIGISGQKVSAATAADVDSVAKKYFPANRTTIIAVGEEKVVRDALSPFGLPFHTVR